MKNSVKPVPDGYHTATPYLVIADAAKASDFYAKASTLRSYFGCRVLEALSRTPSSRSETPG